RRGGGEAAAVSRTGCAVFRAVSRWHGRAALRCRLVRAAPGVAGDGLRPLRLRHAGSAHRARAGNRPALRADLRLPPGRRDTPASRCGAGAGSALPLRERQAAEAYALRAGGAARTAGDAASPRGRRCGAAPPVALSAGRRTDRLVSAGTAAPGRALESVLSVR